MQKKHTKKKNPRRTPLAKSAFNKDAILEEATRDDMYRAWLLVVNALIELELVEAVEIPELANSVNRYISSGSFRGKTRDDEMSRAERMMGIANPYEHLHPETVKSPIELELFKKKVFKVATHTALCVIYLGLESTRRFHSEDLRRLFFNVDLTLAEIDSGCNSYAALEENLASQLITIEQGGDNYDSVKITM